MSRPPLSLFVAAVAMVWVPATGILIARSLPTVPDEVKVVHQVEVRVHANTSHEVEVDAGVDVGQVRFGNLRIDVPNIPVPLP